MTTRDKYTEVPAPYSWEVPSAGDARFTWEYDDGRARLLSLYQKGKDKQGDAQSRIDWSQDVDPMNPIELPNEFHPLFGSPMWDAANDARRAEMRQHFQAWQLSQFLHGEQGAMVCAAKIVEVVPDLDAKFYAATQTMDEARHVEAFSRFLQEKVDVVYPINKHLTALLDDTLRDSRWDMPYLGMQVLIEGLALAAFGVLRDMSAQDSLARKVLAYVMQDEARHVAFGRISLKDYYSALTEAERGEREEFVVDACYLMRDRFRGEEVFETLGMDVQACAEWVDTSPLMIQFRSHLFSRIVPIVKDIGLWGGEVQKAFRDMGVLEDDLISALGAAEIDGEKLTNEEIFSFLRLLLPAGVETTYRSLGSLLLGLLSDPEQLDAIRADRSLIPQAIEEGVRWEPPLLTITRVATRDTELGGVKIPAGCTVMPMLGAANRQEDRYSDPDTFNIHRQAKANLGWGQGVHVCLGMHLARLEMRTAINLLLDRLPNLRLDPEADDPHVRGQVFRSPTSVPVLFDPQ